MILLHVLVIWSVLGGLAAIMGEFTFAGLAGGLLALICGPITFAIWLLYWVWRGLNALDRKGRT